MNSSSLHLIFSPEIWAANIFGQMTLFFLFQQVDILS